MYIVLYYTILCYTLLSVTVIFFLIYCSMFSIDSGSVVTAKQPAPEGPLDSNFLFIRRFPIIARQSQ